MVGRRRSSAQESDQNLDARAPALDPGGIAEFALVGNEAAPRGAPAEPQYARSPRTSRAVAHRDYTSNGSVQVMLFADRLEVWNPGRLPPSLTLQKLREPHGSVPGNPLLAEPMYLAGYIERMGTGTGDMIRRCVAAGLPEPDFFVGDGFVTRIRRPEGGSPTSTSRGTPHETPQDTPHDAPHDAAALTDEVARLLLALEGEMTRAGLMTILGLKDRKHFTRGYLLPATAGGCIEKTRPDALQSRQQKYRLTELGRALRAQLTKKTEQRP